MFCSKCGHENDNNSYFCSSCGNPLKKEASVAPPSATTDMLSLPKRLLKNKWFKILGGVVAVILLAVIAAFYFTSGIVDAADGFFKAVKEQDLAKARSYLSEDFRAGTDENALADFLSKSAILNVKECSWSNRQMSGDRGELEGSVKTETGGVVPIKMMFVKENGNWKIYAIRKPATGLQSESSPPTAPSKSAQVALVKQSTHDFIVSINKKDMGHFRNTVSRLWKKQHSTTQLNQAFKAIMDADANWALLDSYEPVLADEATINQDGVLILTGYYPTKPSQVHFEQKYIYEGLAWKLLGFNIKVK
jgi:hypothetical protein